MPSDGRTVMFFATEISNNLTTTMMNHALRRCPLVVVARKRSAVRCFANTTVAARGSRQSVAEEKRAATMEAYLASSTMNGAGAAPDKQQAIEPAAKVDETRGDEWRVKEREFLMEEAGYMARSLYRTCLRSVRTLRPGNERDEQDFREREEKQLSDLDEEGGGSVMFSMEPPVNRQNELQSRAEYYYTHLRENYNSDSECLDRELWKEHDIETFLHFLRKGEKRRRYVLKDYRFKDPYKATFDADRVKKFETRANELLRDTYQVHGWLLMADVKAEDFDTEYDPEFDFDDDPQDKHPKV
jgi:hypothetical protein